ncbi:MAG: N-acetyltransferase [Rhodospirillales bacterium]|nr:N-acetyltransferase [Rhodospirillales bacterium]
MPDGSEISIKVLTRISEVSAEEWNACAGESNPFVRYAFLNALEESGSVCAETGWQPQHLVVNDEQGKIAACMPMYLKNHSYGEYIFDWGWADAYERAGGKYYPKLQSAVPFTPATGPRMLVRSDAPEKYFDILIAGMVQLARQLDVSSLHVTFPPSDQWDRLGAAGFLLRSGKQFHWENKGYDSFDDFLDELSSRKRKAIRKERREVANEGVTLKCLTGDDITEDHWDSFYHYYLSTIDHKWGRAYLTREFFSILGESMSDMAMMVVAEQGGERIAGALNLVGDDTLFGRNWGCSKEIKFLHFEACYYQAIDFAIENKLKWVEAGAQGPHKIQRGYLPREIYSAHWIKDANFRDAVANFVNNERRDIDYEIQGLMGYSPYRNSEQDC